MITKCPFYPNEINPCTMHNCHFQCTGGCAISLAAYAADAYEETKKLKEKLNSLESQLNNIDNKFGRLIQQLSRQR